MNTNTQQIVKNLDFALRANKTKSVVVVSDHEKEGKSTFIKECAPLLSELYDRKILVIDCQPERKDVLESAFASGSVTQQFIHRTSTDGLDYIHVKDLLFLETLPKPEMMSSLNAFLMDVSKNYDLVLINSKTQKKSERVALPGIPFESAIIVRSKKSINKKWRPVTKELKKRDVPILGLVMNGGI